MRLTRHATNRARGLGIVLAGAEAVIRGPADSDFDETDKPRYYGVIRNVNVCIVVALYEPDLIVTIYDRRR